MSTKSRGKNPMASNPIAMKVTTDPRALQPRGQIEDFDDPDLPGFHYPDDTVCTRCGAVVQNQHWTLDEARRDLIVAAGSPVNSVVCPGCKITVERNPRGILKLAGDYWPQHRDDILNLVRNEENAGMRDNPLERVIDIREEAGCLIIETTREKLAQRIGRAVHSAHKGELEYQWPDGDRLVRVNWERSGGQ